MTHRDDYLWDRSGEPDPTIEQLERLLAPLAHDDRALPLDALPAQRPVPAPAPRRGPWLLVAAAALLGVAVTAWLLYEPQLAEGDAPRTIATGKTPQTIELGALVELTLHEHSEIRFEHWRKDQALFSLLYGTVEARVAPFPAVQVGFFQIETGLGRVIDQGCKYVLTRDTEDSAHVRVTEGAVTFAFPQRTVFVPAGANTIVAAGIGPSTPLFADCTPELRKAVRFYDELAEKSRSVKEGGSEMRLKGLEMVREYCRDRRDSLPLWHMLSDDDEMVRDQAEAALLELVGPPVAMTKSSHWEPEIWLAFLRMNAW